MADSNYLIKKSALSSNSINYSSSGEIASNNVLAYHGSQYPSFTYDTINKYTGGFNPATVSVLSLYPNPGWINSLKLYTQSTGTNSAYSNTIIEKGTAPSFFNNFITITGTAIDTTYYIVRSSSKLSVRYNSPNGTETASYSASSFRDGIVPSVIIAEIIGGGGGGGGSLGAYGGSGTGGAAGAYTCVVLKFPTLYDQNTNHYYFKLQVGKYGDSGLAGAEYHAAGKGGTSSIYVVNSNTGNYISGAGSVSCLGGNGGNATSESAPSGSYPSVTTGDYIFSLINNSGNSGVSIKGGDGGTRGNKGKDFSKYSIYITSDLDYKDIYRNYHTLSAVNNATNGDGGGGGAASPFGRGGKGGDWHTFGSGDDGESASTTSYGAGGGGAGTGNSGANGGNGAPGAIRLWY